MTEWANTGKQHIKHQAADHRRHTHQGPVGNQQNVSAGETAGTQPNADGNAQQKGDYGALQAHFCSDPENVQ